MQDSRCKNVAERHNTVTVFMLTIKGCRMRDEIIAEVEPERFLARVDSEEKEDPGMKHKVRGNESMSMLMTTSGIGSR